MKNIITKITIAFLLITMVTPICVPLGAHAVDKITSKVEIENNNINNIAKVQKVESNKITTTASKTTKTSATNSRTETLNKLEEKETTEGITEGIEGIEAKLETYTHKNFAEIVNPEKGSVIVSIVYIKNTSENKKELQLKSDISKLLGGKIITTICDVEEVFEEGKIQKGIIAKETFGYRETINVTLNPGEEKAIKIEQHVGEYISSTVENVFQIKEETGTITLKDEAKNILEPAEINAEMKLYVNNMEIPDNGNVTLTDSDKIKYVINIENNGGTASQINIENTMPNTFEITNIAYLDSNNKVLSEVYYSNNKLESVDNVINPGEGLKIELTVEAHILGTVEVSNFATLTGNDIGTLSTNILKTTFVKNSGKEIKIEEPTEKEEPKKGVTEDILAYFGDISFLGYEEDEATNPRSYGVEDIGEDVIIRSADMFTTENIFCVNLGAGYWRFFNIENFYAIYNAERYRYNKDTDELVKNDIPTEGIGIGDDYNLIDENYDKLAYILSQIDNYNSQEYYESLGIEIEFDGERPHHTLSPVQIAIWKLQGVKYSYIRPKMREALRDLGVEEDRINAIIDNIFDAAAGILANARAYEKYVENGKIDSIPQATFENYEAITVNGKTLVGPFEIQYNLETAVATYPNSEGEQITKNGKYGEILNISLSNNGIEYTKIYDSQGNEISLQERESRPLNCYFDITGTDFDFSKETQITMEMNNKYRHAYFFTLESIYDRQNIIIGRGTSTTGTYTQTFEVNTISLSGKVWLDIEQGIKPVLPPNGIIDENEEGIKNVIAYLYSHSKGEIVEEVITNTLGEYEFIDVLQDEYSIIFAYEGINYIATDTTGDSKAEENFIIDGKNIRTNFNKRFEQIEKDKKITKLYMLSPEGIVKEFPANYTMEYQTTLNEEEAESKLITEIVGITLPVYVMYAKTIETYNETTNNINFGLTKREANLRLFTDIHEIENLNSKIRKQVFGGVGKTETKENPIITYKIELRNTNSIFSQVNNIVNYYDERLEYIPSSAEYRYFVGEELITTNNITVTEGEPLIIEGKTYNTLNISGLDIEILEEGETATVYLSFKVKDKEYLKEEFTVFGEITSYTIEGGIIDKNSQPGNGINEDSTILDEDDFDRCSSSIAQFIKRKLLEQMNRILGK